jgi:plastocyanin
MRSRSQSLALGALLVFALTVVGCGDSNPAAPTPPPTGGGGGGGTAANVTITIVGQSGNQSYSPNPASVRVGQTVAWRNGDSVDHTATANGGAFNTGNIAPGATSTAITMNAAGSFDYHCGLHPAMVGTLVVTQ